MYAKMILSKYCDDELFDQWQEIYDFKPFIDFLKKYQDKYVHLQNAKLFF